MKVRKRSTTDNEQTMKMYDHYIAIDWSIEGASIGRMRSNSIEPTVKDISANIKTIKEYLKELKGSKILTIEETTGAHWLYVELKDSVEKIIICNPNRNGFLAEGSKTDRIDAGKLCQLLRSGLLKEVYHNYDEENYKIRKLVKAYNAMVKTHVRVKNQFSAVYRAVGIKAKRKNNQYYKKDKKIEFILEHQTRVIRQLDEEKGKFEELFKEIIKENEIIKYITEISGFGNILSVKVYGLIIDPGRFKNKYNFWAYSGLVKQKRESGKRSYSRKSKLYSREIKSIFKMATKSALGGKNDIREYYENLLKEGFTEKDARNAVTRYLATSVYAVMKNKIKYEPYRWRKNTKSKAA